MKLLKRNLIPVFICLLFSTVAFAQSNPLDQARMAADMKDFPKAMVLFKDLFAQQPTDGEIYAAYLQTLIQAKDYDAAKDLVEIKLKQDPDNPFVLLDLGHIYLLSGKEKKATEPFEKALAAVNGDDLLTTRLANGFNAIQQYGYAAKVYEKARDILRNGSMYSGSLSRMYALSGETDKAVTTLLDGGPAQPGGVEDTKATMLELLGTDSKKLSLAQKTIIKRINEQPENTFYSEMLTWLYTQRDDWEGALMQISALDARLKEGGQRLVEFARLARREGQYDIALQALDAAAEEAKDSPVYPITRAEALAVRMQRLRETPLRTQAEVAGMVLLYQTFLSQYPQYYTTETLRDYAELLAQFTGQPKRAIVVIDSALALPNSRRDFAGLLRLQSGDYMILTGDVWDASLRYSQVDKAFREDALGEEARYRNAKLAWYRGDFEWAQGQLSVLKASTSELIANDALYLSVLITENIPSDSNLVPLQRFAYADLLLFQNQDSAASKLLDSVVKAFPQHPLQDDILMQQARIAKRRGDYNGALKLYAQIYDAPKSDKKDDLLADDALFSAADVSQNLVKDNLKAKELYETLLLRFPGSTFTQRARERLDAINAPPVLP